jgi:Cu/Ag efflux pump CusA
MTALATAGALLPLALAGNIAGQEIAHPMALVILGGLVTSTLLTIVLLPPLYLRFGGVSDVGGVPEHTPKRPEAEARVPGPVI